LSGFEFGEFEQQSFDLPLLTKLGMSVGNHGTLFAIYRGESGSGGGFRSRSYPQEEVRGRHGNPEAGDVSS